MSTNGFSVAFQIISIMITDNLFCSGTTVTTEHGNASQDNDVEVLFKAETVQAMPIIPKLVVDELLAYHNHVRRTEKASNMIELHWDLYLAMDASERIHKCDYQLLQISYQNADFVTSFDSDYNLTEVLKKWHSQRKNFDFKSGVCRGHCDSYTNMVRADTIQVGCSIAHCKSIRGYETEINNAILLACRYFTPNYRFRPKIPFRAGKVCSKCPEKFEVCHSGLCAGQKSSYPPWDPNAHANVERLVGPNAGTEKLHGNQLLALAAITLSTINVRA